MDTPSQSSLIEHAEAQNVIKVPTISIDTLIDRSKPDLIKLDVEGFEPQLLRASSRLKARDAPPLIVEDNSGVRASLMDLDYSVIELRSLLPPDKRSLANFSSDVLAYRKHLLDREQFQVLFNRQLATLQSLPGISYRLFRDRPD